MNRPRLPAVSLAVLLGAVALSGCDRPAPTGQARADAETRAACENRAEQAYEQQNRAEIYAPQSQVNTPYSANYLTDNTSRGLSDLFVHDRMVTNCIRNTGTGTEGSPPAPSRPPPPLR
jgi:outer membrane murein-binding lipoprotein Lpp